MIFIGSQVSNLTDARYFAAKEVNYLCFNLEEGSPGYLDPMYMKAIREWVEGPRIIGTFETATPAYVREAVVFFNLDGIMIPYHTYMAELDQFSGINVLIKLPLTPDIDLSAIFEKTSAYVLLYVLVFDIKAVDLIYQFKAEILKHPVVFQPDLPADAISPLVAEFPQVGLCLEGGEEEKTGVKSFDEIDFIFESFGR